jgi:hypothetical protein
MSTADEQLAELRQQMAAVLADNQRINQQYNQLAQHVQQQQQQQQQQHQQQPLNNNNNMNNNNLAAIMRPSKPNVFKGLKNENAQLFITELNNYFAATQLVNNDRTVFALSHLKDDALLWQSSIAELNANVAHNVPYDRFTALFLARFNPVNSSTQARLELRMLKFVNVTQYISSFLSLMQRISDMNPADQIHHFIHALPTYLKLECMKNVTTYTTVQEFVNLVQRLDSVTSMMLNKPASNPFAYANSSSSSSSSSSSNDQMQIDVLNQMSFDYNNQSMHDAAASTNNNNDTQQQILDVLNAIRFSNNNNNNNKKWSAEKEKLFKERKCFICQKVGHISKNCFKNPNRVNNNNNNQSKNG